MNISEEQMLNYIITNKDWNIVVENDINESYFKDNKEQFKYIKQYYDVYKQLPDELTFYSTFDTFEKLDVNCSKQYLVDALKNNKIKNDTIEVYNSIRDVITSPRLTDQQKTDRIAAETTKLNKLLISSQSLSYSNIDDLTSLAIDTFNERKTNLSKHFYKIGIDWLDNIFLGWDKDNDYVVVAGRPGTGKSMLLCKFAAEQIKAGKRVAFYEGEMSKVQTFERIVAALKNNISATDLLKANDEVKEDYFNYLQHQWPNNPSMGTISMLTPQDLGSRYPTTYQLETFVRKTNADILFIDQLSLMSDLEQAKVPFEKAANISRQIKALRDTLNIPVICASQMNRTQNDNNKVDTNQVAASDVIVQDCCKLIMLTNSKEDSDESTVQTMHIAKNRTGRTYVSQKFSVDFAHCKYIEIVDTNDGDSEAL